MFAIHVCTAESGVSGRIFLAREPVWRLAALCVLMAGAAWTDLRYGKVRNGWLLAGFLAGIVTVGNDFLVGAVPMFLIAFFIFHLRLMGAGDGKLMILIAGYMGFWNGLTAIWAGSMIGAVWSVCRLWQDRSFRARLSVLSAYIVRVFSQQQMIMYEDFKQPGGRHRIPFAACLAAGVYCCLLAAKGGNL